MNHIPRLRIEIKPRNEDFRLTDLKKIVTFLWAASPRLNQLHAEYCGPASTIAPGLEFTNIFNFLPFTYLSDAEWRGEPAETVFTHGPPIPTTTKMLKTPDVMRHSAFAQFAAREISEMDNLESLLEATTIRVKDLEGEIGTLPGAYDFSHLADIDPVQRTIRFAQHAGTMNSDAIKNWIKVCHGLVSFCLDTCKQRVDRIFEQLEVSSAEAYTVYDILKDIDLVSQADYYLDKGSNPFVPDLACHRRIPTVNLADTRDLPPYTFGIEVEFLVPYSHENTPDPYPSDPRWVYRYNPDADQHDPSEDARTVSHSGNAEYLAKMLNKAGHFSVTLYRLLDACNDIEGDRAQALATLAKSSGLNMRLVDKVEPMFQTWLAQPDFSLSSFHSGFLGYSGGITGVELCSPILRDQQTDFDKIVNIVKLVRNSMRPMLNPTCGFHVHVGNVRNFSLLSLKRIVTLIWAADPILYSLVHPSRRENAYSIPPRKGSKLANNQDLPPYSDVWNLRRDKLHELEIESHVPMDKIPDRLQREIYQIWSAVNERVLIGLVGSPVGARTGISLHRIKPVEDMDTENPAATVYEGTIEFRCLEGTLHPELIVQWVKLLLAIVAKAEASTVWKYFTIMSEVLKEHKSDREQLAGFLHVLDLGSAESFWEKTAEMNRTLAVGVVSEDDSNQPSEWEMVFDEGESTRSRYENDTVVVHPLANNEAIGIETNIP
ncbi:uncharacterized protein CTRU02_208205 [Colletotrichum truncatum]|uniref:Uncharacterized protein n=1 Tax=Colletotrichum truncatum TaxID=5467 RepID=A0ACC3YVM5_COLTU|nr:uncharacterized protein CTRU02_07614 [Colletotrichum truncatum]KAF6791274.1 hypothetical protein CTRU02_07614 [Colletotrichum truncatum]